MNMAAYMVQDDLAADLSLQTPELKPPTSPGWLMDQIGSSSATSRSASASDRFGRRPKFTAFR